jgi:hypothetical protein
MVGPGGGYIFFIDYMDQYADLAGGVVAGAH